MRLQLDEGARLDLCDATMWFASIDPKLGRDFVTAVNAAFESIRALARKPLHARNVDQERRHPPSGSPTLSPCDRVRNL